MRRLEELVSRLLREHGGGEAYFDNFDAEMRRPESLAVVRSLLDVPGNVVASGRFGRYLLGLREAGAVHVGGNFVLTDGGLRKGAAARLIHQDAPPRGAFTFLDDSYYSGTTERSVAALLRGEGAELSATRVVYDGSPAKLPHVFSLYRYYDRHGACAADEARHGD
jgi:hypothetical protein